MHGCRSCTVYGPGHQQKGSWFEFICLNAFLDPSGLFIYQIKLQVFLWHIRARFFFFCKCACSRGHKDPLCMLGHGCCFHRGHLSPRARTPLFLTLISVSAFWLDPGLKSITHRSSSHCPMDGHKLINSWVRSKLGEFKCVPMRGLRTICSLVAMILFHCLGTLSIPYAEVSP